jgi:ankyrin repeat protein
MVNQLLEAGADVDAADKFGRTPLHIAAEKSLDVVQTLLKAGANRQIRDKRGFTPADTARRNACGNIQCGAIFQLLSSAAPEL